MIPSIDPKLVFEVFNDELGFVAARCLNARITTRAAGMESFEANLTAAIAEHYGEAALPSPEEVHLVFDEELAFALKR
jgi:hypothetical protein